MGVTNWMVQRAMDKQAEKVAKWAAETYPVIKTQNEGLPDQEIHLKMLPGGDKRSQMSDGTRHLMDECSQTIEGVCYLALIIGGATKGMMAFRLLQLTTCIDRALYARGFKQQSKAMKERILAALDLRLDDWEKIAGEA